MFEIINGGLSENTMSSKKKFISGYVTNTRLMGVVCVYAKWFLSDNEQMQYMHQFFYLDAEEFGLDTYECILGPDNEETNEEVSRKEDAMAGGLGGKKIPIDECELLFLIQDYASFNRKNGFELPMNNPEFAELLSKRVDLSFDEQARLMRKQCEPVTTEYQAINYFLMRCFGRDFTAAKYLTGEIIRTDIFPELHACTLLKNEIEEVSSSMNIAQDGDSFKTRRTFLNQSVVEDDGNYYMVVTEVTLEGLKVVKYARNSAFGLSEMEVGMLTSRSEYITSFSYLGDIENFNSDSIEMLKKAQRTPYDSGILFMLFNPSNAHVKNRIFRLNDDVFGVLFVQPNNQVLVSAFDKQNIKSLENDLMLSNSKMLFLPTAKYCFNDPVLFDYIQSGFDDFEEFVDMISETEE